MYIERFSIIPIVCFQCFSFTNYPPPPICLVTGTSGSCIVLSIVHWMNKSKPGYLYLPTAGHPQGAATLAYSNIQQLQSQAQRFITLGLAPTTRSTYSAGWKRFTSFCAEFGLLSTPASEHTLLLFVTSLAVSNLSYCMALLKYIYLLFATFMFCPAFTQTSTTSLPPPPASACTSWNQKNSSSCIPPANTITHHPPNNAESQTLALPEIVL